MVNKKFIFFLFSAIIFTGLIGAITFQQIAPTTNPFITPSPNVTISTGVHCPDGCSSFTESWNGSNTTLYDSSLVLFMNFDNRSALGENDTIVKDLSMYGNNGTVVGGENITWTANGKYGGAFNFSGSKSYMTFPVDSELNFSNYSPFTISVWVKPNVVQVNADTWNIISFLSTTRGISISYTKDSDYQYFKTMMRMDNGTISQSQVNNSNPLFFRNVILSFNGSHMSTYLDSNLVQTIGGVKIDPLKNGYIGGNYIVGGTANYFNGSIDDVMIFNKSLSATEIIYLYNFQATKYNSSYWILNSSNKVTSILSQPSFLCTKNTTLDNFCTATQNIRGLATLKSNFSTSKMNIKDYFYGVNTVSKYISGYSYNIDTDNNYILDTPTDYQYHREMFLNSNINLIRMDINLENLYENLTFKKDFEEYTNTIKFAYDNNLKVEIIITGTPPWLANISTGWCNWTTSNSSCSPNNYTKWTNAVNLTLYTLTSNHLYDSVIYGVNVLNEAWGQSYFLDNLSTSQYVTRYTEYEKVWNATYDGVMLYNSSIKIGGGDFQQGTFYKQYFMSMYLNGTLGNRTNYTSLHPYIPSTTTENYLINTDLNNFYSNCTTYNINCSDVLLSEINFENVSLKNESTQQSNYSKSIANMYSLLFNGAYNLSLEWYTWSSRYSYINNSANYSQYPQKRHMILDKQFNSLDSGEITVAYNVTKNFAHLCPSGATISVTSSDSTCLKQVACQKGNMYALIPINVCDYAINVTVNMTNNTNSKMFPYTSIMNYETGASIPVSTSGIAQLGVLDGYEVVYLTSGDEDGGTLVNLFKFNEATGTRVYDLLQNVTYGTISGATWINDSILITLSAVQYTIDLVTGLLTLDTDYLYEYLFVDYDYNKVFGFHVSILGVIAGFLMIIVLGVGIIYVVKYFKNIKELE